MSAAAVAAAEQVEVIEDMIQVVQHFTACIARINVPAVAIGLVKTITESAEQLGHGQVCLAITVVDGRIKDHRFAVAVRGPGSS